jgi:hypothetical protein
VQIYQHFTVDEAQVALKALNENLEKIYQWSIRNGLNLNDKKCQHLLLGSRQYFNIHPANECCHFNAINLNNSILQTCDKAKNLGMIFDRHLSWEDHILTQCKSGLQKIRYLSRFKNFLNTKTRCKLMTSLIIPKLEYGNLVYLNSSKVLLSKIQKIQNSCVRFTLNLPRRTNINKFLAKLKWLSMDKRRQLQALALVHKTVKSSSPQYLYEILFANSVTHEHETRLRYSDALRTPSCHTTKRQRSFVTEAINWWNSLPKCIKDLACPNLFRKRVFELLLQND